MFYEVKNWKASDGEHGQISRDGNWRNWKMHLKQATIQMFLCVRHWH